MNNDTNRDHPRDMNVAARNTLSEPLDSSSAEQLRNSSSAGRGGTYLLTWTTHGTWLPGHPRGFVSRVPTAGGGQHPVHNQPGTPYDRDMPTVQRAAAVRQRGPALRLTTAHADICVAAFREVAARYRLRILVGAVMANHVHLVVESPDAEGPRLLNLFKGVSSRRLGQRFAQPDAGHWWTRHGSRRLLMTSDSIERAVRYVREQTGALVVFRETFEPLDSSSAVLNEQPRDVNVAARSAKKPHTMNGAAQTDLPIALSGRVYCYVDATQNAVEIGDLLTTSDAPGHAMKVTDFARSQGAVLGKAMEPLAKGEKGLVLVLVALQ